jgi:hypothetical protein
MTIAGLLSLAGAALGAAAMYLPDRGRRRRALLRDQIERLDRGVTWDQFKRHLILKGPQISLPTLKQVKTAA